MTVGRRDRSGGKVAAYDEVIVGNGVQGVFKLTARVGTTGMGVMQDASPHEISDNAGKHSTNLDDTGGDR